MFSFKYHFSILVDMINRKLHVIGVGCMEHQLHPQRDTFRPSGWSGVYEGFGTGRREPEVLLAGKKSILHLYFKILFGLRGK